MAASIKEQIADVDAQIADIDAQISALKKQRGALMRKRGSLDKKRQKDPDLVLMRFEEFVRKHNEEDPINTFSTEGIWATLSLTGTEVRTLNKSFDKKLVALFRRKCDKLNELSSSYNELYRYESLNEFIGESEVIAKEFRSIEESYAQALQELSQALDELTSS